MTDTLKAVSKNTAISANKFLEEPVGEAVTRRWVDWNKPVPPEETRTAEEVIEHIRNKLAST